MNSYRKPAIYLWGSALIFAIVYYSISAYWNENLFSAPVDLSVVGERKFIINTRFDSHYSIELGFDNKSIDGYSLCGASRDNSCEVLLEELDVEISLIDQGSDIFQNSSNDRALSSLSGGRFFVSLESFQGMPGRDLELTFRNRSSSPDLNALNPELALSVSPIQIVNHAYTLFFMMVIEAILIVLAVVFSFLCWFKRRKNEIA